MEMFKIGESNNTGGYFSSEQIDFLSIVQCQDYEALKKFIIECEQLKNIFSEEDLISYSFMDIEDAKKDVFKAYQETLVSHFSTGEQVLENTLSRMNLKDREKEDIKKAYKLKGEERYSYIRDYLQKRYPEKAEDLFIQSHRIISKERDQNKDSDLYDEFVFLNENLSFFDTMLIASAKPEIVINEIFKKDNPNRFDFYFAKRDLDFACENNKQVRLHSLLTQCSCKETFDGKTKEEILETLENYVKTTIDFVRDYNSTHKLSNGKPVIQAIDLFNEIVSFDENEKGEYESIWEKKYGISIKEICDVFKYAKDNKPEGVCYLYNEPFLENPKRRKKVIETLDEINKNSNNLIDTLGSQMHITLGISEEEIKNCFDDFKKLQDEKGLNIQITEFDLSLSESDIMKIIGENPKATYELAYELKKEKIEKIYAIIQASDVNLSGISYWSLTDKIDCNLERIRAKLLEKGIIKDPKQVLTACGALFPTLNKYLNKKSKEPEPSKEARK